jgi:hypothetical protein
MTISVPSREDFSAASGIVNIGGLQSIYKRVIDETFVDMGRPITIHLEPRRTADNTTISQPQANRYSPFFGGVPVPRTTTQIHGVQITPRDVQYTAHIRVGPIVEGDDKTGMGELKANELMLTLHINALDHVKQALSVTVEGRRYKVIDTRPVGLTKRDYLLVKLEEINEKDLAQGENEG